MAFTSRMRFLDILGDLDYCAAHGGARLNFAVLFTWQLPGTPGFQFELLQNCFKWPRNKQQQSKIAHDSIKLIG